MAAILTHSGRVAIAASIKARSAHHLAWGTGDPTWGNTPPSPPSNATALLAEIGRLKATQVDYCTPAANGAIGIPEGNYEVTQTPTNNLYFKFHFEFADAVGSTIRETGIFLDTVAAAGLVRVGVYLLDEVITELQDPTLRCPAVQTRNYNEPGAGRLRVTPTWGREGDGSDGSTRTDATISTLLAN